MPVDRLHVHHARAVADIAAGREPPALEELAAVAAGRSVDDAPPLPIDHESRGPILLAPDLNILSYRDPHIAPFHRSYVRS